MKPEIQQYEINNREINYAVIGADSLPTAIFFHGAPGSWSAFIDFMKDEDLIKHVQIVSVDRPGYGHSNFGNSVTSLTAQAKLLQPLLDKFSHTKNILIGHSLGGPVIARIAMDFPEITNSLIMVAPSIDPSLEPDEDWFRFPLRTPFLRWILPTSFRVTNDEIYFLEEELEIMMPLWEKIKLPVTVIQGGEDSLVPPANASFAKKMLVNAESLDIMFKEDMNHFVPWNNPQLIKEAIMKYAAKN